MEKDENIFKAFSVLCHIQQQRNTKGFYVIQLF